MAEFVSMRREGDRELEIYQFYNLIRPFPNHFHEGFMLGCLLRGRRVMLLRQKEIMVLPGQLIYVPPHMPHGCRPVNGEEADWICVQASSCHLMWPTAEPQIINNQSLGARFVAAALNHEYEGELGKTMGEILGRQKCKPLAETHETMEPKPQAGENKYRYLRTFRQAMGITPGRYGESMRINRAKKLIMDGFSLAEAAEEFCDQSHMNRVFKKNLGVTPGAWREAYARSSRQ